MKTFALNSNINVVEFEKDVLTIEFAHQPFCVKKSFVKTLSKKLVDFSKDIPLKKGEIDWDEIKVGTHFTAFIENEIATGEIQKNGIIIYLCQNTLDGQRCNNRLGYKYSWTIDEGSLEKLGGNSVSLISFAADSEVKKKDAPMPPSYKHDIGYEIQILRGCVKIGCQGIPNYKIRELVKIMDK